MAPSEDSILVNFLLSPSLLPTIISLEKFTALFPRRLQSHPQIRSLYRELQHLRAQDVDLVQENIQNETRLGEKQKEDLKNAKSASGLTGLSQDDQMEIDLDIQIFGQSSALTTRPEDQHSLESLLPELERACADLEDNVESLDAEAAEILSQLTTTVEGLSDLRYGKFNRVSNALSLGDEVVGSLQHLENVCKRANGN